MKPRVALAVGGSRRQNVSQALELISGEVDLRAKSCVLIKPNIPSSATSDSGGMSMAGKLIGL